MKIEQLEIYGFGKWVDETFHFSKQTLTCLYGENEAGKSTLQQFIMFILFGFPPKRRNFYKPKQSNRVGGTMTISDSNIGTYTIERIEGEVTCYLPTGENVGEDWLKNQLKGLTEDIYRSVYSFSANDLTNIRDMKANELSDVLFSVGLTGATSIYEVEKQLDKEIGELFKKTGRLPLINEQLTKISDIQQKMQADKKREVSYQEKIFDKESLEEEISTAEQKLRQLKEKLLDLEKMKQLIPTLKQYQLLSQKLQTYPNDLTFPEDGRDRYESLKQYVVPLKSEWEVLEQSVHDLEGKINHLSESLYDDELFETAQTLVKEYQQVQVRENKIAEYEKELVQVNLRLTNLLNTSDLLETELDDVVLPFHVEKSWQALIEMNIQLQQESEKITDDHQMLTEALERLKKEADVLHDQLLSDEELEQMEERVDSFRMQQVKEQWTTLQTKRNKISRGVLWSSSIVAIIAFIFAIYTENYALLAISAMLAFVVIGQMYVAKVSSKDMDELDGENELLLSKEEIESVEQRLAKQRKLEADLLVVESEQKRLQMQDLQLTERKRMFAQKESKWMHQIEETHEQYPFLKTIEPAYWVEFLHTVQSMKELLADKRHIQEQIQTLEHANRTFKDKLIQFIFDLNTDKPMNMEQIENSLDKQRSDIQLIEQYRNMQEESRNRQNELASQISIYETEIEQLFQKALVDSEDQYLKAANNFEERNELLKEKEALLQQLLLSMPEAQIEAVLQQDLHENKVAVQISEVTDNIQLLENELENNNQALTTKKLEINQLESAEEISKTAYLFEMEKDKLNQLAKRWAVLKTAQATLIQAKNTYQEKHLHEVIHYTTDYFNRLTRGHYTKVFAPTEIELFQVEAYNNIRYTVNELSQGTIDQLYVSLRLAISKVMNHKMIVPLIIDDAFVHFDEHRTKKVIELLKEITRESDQQILLFTCKRNIAEQLKHNTIKKLTEVS